ncbi:hydrolase [Murdochiella sp. Marseille-P8839]|nr:hydrolase [Murdochiella sp. Marseille-P8839]
MKNLKTHEGKFVPQVGGALRHNILELPPVMRKSSGILVFGRRIKTFVFSTDLAIIRNCDADAVFAVYPFTPQQTITDAIIKNSYIPVFAGVGGSITNGQRSVDLAKDVESQGAMAVVVNASFTNENLHAVTEAIDIPVVVTITSREEDVGARLNAGARLLNVAGAHHTAEIVRCIREKFPEVPIIASGGNREDLIRETIDAGANAITYTPPSTAELFTMSMNEHYRSGDPASEHNDGSLVLVDDAEVADLYSPHPESS